MNVSFMDYVTCRNCIDVIYDILPVLLLDLLLATLSAMMSHGFKSSKQDFTFGPWRVTAAKTHIMKSKDIER